MVNNPTNTNGLINLIPYTMQTFKNLIELIALETELNEGKQMTMEFSINTHYKWISFTQCHNLEGLEDNQILKMESYKSNAQLQQIYWTIYNNGRAKYND